MSPVSATYWGIPGYAIFWVFFAIAFSLFVLKVFFLLRLMRLGKHENRFDKIGQRIRNMLIEVVPQRCNLKSVTKKDLAGIGHAFIFWGFMFFLISYIVFIGLGEGFGLHSIFMGGTFEMVYSSILDFAGIFVTAAIVWAAVRRYIIRPERLELSAEAGIIMIMIFGLMTLHFCIEGFGFASSGIIHDLPPVGAAFARFLAGTGIPKSTLTGLYQGSWWLHYALILGFVIYIPRSKHLHVLASPFNLFFRTLGPKVVLEPIPLEAPEGAETFGVSKIQDFRWKDMLDFYSCAVCGRCHVNCPAQLSGKSLSPREVIQNLKDHLLESGHELLNSKSEGSPANAEKNMIGDVVTEEEIWACTTCGACQEVCPVGIEHVRKIIELRQNLVMSQSKMPESAQLMLRNMQSRGHPWSGAQSIRLREDWTNDQGLKILTEGDSINTLLWVGCTGALIERNIEATLALTKVLKAAGVEFGVLGGAEPCCGDPARRAGYDFQFQILAEENIELLKSYNIKEIITSCPHCFNTLKNEYPLYSGDFKVIHYTQLVTELINEGKLNLTNELDSTVTYHDPCYLSRYNEVYKEPRRILQAIPKAKLDEMERSQKNTFCCGGGGGHLWIEEQPGTTKINHIRLEDVLKTSAGTVVTSCPYCLQMLEEGIEHKGIKDSMKARDLIELVEESMKQS